MQEQTLELARRAFFPGQPSRLQSIFCFSDAEDISYWPELASNNGRIFEIANANGMSAKLDSSYLKGGITVVDGGYIARSTPLEIDLASKYWSGSASDFPRFEVLVELPVILGEVVKIS
jgi:hypothetical protein